MGIRLDSLFLQELIRIHLTETLIKVAIINNQNS